MAWTLADSGVVGTALANSPGFVYTYPGGAPASGDLLTLSVSSNTTVSTPSGWTVATSDVGNIGAYLFYRVAGASEPSSVTIVTSGNFPTAIAYLRYSGGIATPLDVVVAARSTVNNTTTPAATTAALAGTGELSIAAGCLGGLNGLAQTSPTWSGGYTQTLNAVTAGVGASDCRVFVGVNPTAGTAAESPNVSWTNSAANQTMLVATFKPAAGGSTPISGADTGAGADVATLTAALAATDTGTGTEARSLTAATSATETGTGTDAATALVALAVSDTASGADAATLAVVLTATELGAGTDATPARSLAAAEVATGADATALAVSLTAAETGASADAGAASVGAIAVNAADTATAADAATVVATLTAADTASGVDAIPSRSLTATDTMQATDAATVSNGLSIDITVVVSPPKRGWSASAPVTGWTASAPVRRWSAGQPTT